ncbi:Cytochrome p450 [Thalictrum thalictroides]|uniref:Cytochrome p450 n=1 Tax=Thalictrum thalictroides TaxID=46969 RepID=A0A7J6X2N5_THATH|nr:Cytochrome p450 [Thalictrum thalictroides]
MLKTNFENYPKGDRFIILLKDFLGQGIFNSDGDLWKIQRKIASFEFSTKSLRTFVIDNVSFELHARLIPLLNNASRMNKIIDIQNVLERFAFDNVCKVAFNEDPACLEGDGTSGSEFMRAFEDAATISAERFMCAFPTIWYLKRKFNIGSEKRLRESIKIVHEFAEKIIKARIQDKDISKKSDLLSRFIATNDENSSNSLEFLRDIVISFILAGRDTTSSALSWFFWLLSSKPDIERNILEEITAIRTNSGKCIGDIFELDELRQMHYLHAAISEAMRLFPPVAVDTKACLKDDVMPDGTFVGEGWFVTYSGFSMGRMEKIWGKDCNEFVPERWLENGTFRPESPFKYPVFHGGPRMCLGKDMGYIQMKSIAASVIEKYEMDVVDKTTCPDHVLSLTLRMKNGLMVKVKERSMNVVDT